LTHTVYLNAVNVTRSEIQSRTLYSQSPVIVSDT